MENKKNSSRQKPKPPKIWKQFGKIQSKIAAQKVINSKKVMADRYMHGEEDEAYEDKDNIYADEKEELRSDEEDGEDIIENMDEDYNAIDKLDAYDFNDLDEGEYSEISIGARRRADRIIEQQEHHRQRHGGRNALQARKLPGAIKDEMEDSVISMGGDVSQELRKRREAYYEELGEDAEERPGEGEAEDERFLDLDNIRGKLVEWIKEDKTVRYIRRVFRSFLLHYRDENNVLVYEERINEMCSNNRQSLEITYNHLTTMNPTLAYWLFETPALILPWFNKVASELACKYFPGYDNIRSEIFVKVRDFPLDEKLRDLRTYHLNTLIRVRGVVTRRYPVYSQLKEVFYICRCGDRKGPIYQNELTNFKLGQCANCQSKGPYIIDSEMAVYRNHQKITVQESPSTVPPGRVPRSKDVVLLGDNIDGARPGEEVEIVGIYKNEHDYLMNMKHGFPVFKTLIEANNLKRFNELQLAEISADDRVKFHELASSPHCMDRIISAIGPSIFGHKNIKTALALALFGGTPLITDTHKIRGDINVLLLGDPGLAKSQFLKYVQGLSHRCVYTTGKGATAVGLTASVRKDPVSGEWSLEGGALVLADNGICLIDEFDKMSDVDRTSIHEAMEQQSISISKAGIVASLQARCSVIAAANPIRGMYDNQLSFQDNVNLSDPILSRFDVLFKRRDRFRARLGFGSIYHPITHSKQPLFRQRREPRATYFPRKTQSHSKQEPKQRSRRQKRIRLRRRFFQERRRNVQ